MRTKLIADLTSNHLGIKEVIESMIFALSDCGVDIVKTQSWRSSKLRKDLDNYSENLKYYDRHQLKDSDQENLINLCKKRNIGYLTTCFDIDKINDLKELGLKTVKIASPDANSYKMIESAIENFEEVIISTGATTNSELNKIMKISEGHNVILFHCMTIYPCPLDLVNMDRMLHIRDSGFRFGYSDHTLGTEAAMMAISLGAEFIEKHFTLNRYLPGRDQKMSSTIQDFKKLVEWSKTVESMSGSAKRELTNEELTFRKNYYGKWGNNN